MKRKPGAIEILLGILMFLVLWQFLAWIIARPILPSPVLVLPLFFQSIFRELGLHLLASTGRVLAAIFSAVLTAVPTGLGLGQLPSVDRFFSPLIAIFLPDPENSIFAGYLCPDGDHGFIEDFFNWSDYLFSDPGGGAG